MTRATSGGRRAASESVETDACETRTVFRGGRWWTIELVCRSGSWALWVHREGEQRGWLWVVRGDALDQVAGDEHRAGPGCAWRRALFAPPYLVRLLEGVDLRVGSPRVRPLLPMLVAANDVVAEVG
jgi:hypothetical protein